MLNKTRYDEDRIPTPEERVSVRVLANQAGMSFSQAWIKYMKREQRLLDVIIRADDKIVADEIARGAAPMSTHEAVLETIEKIMIVMGCTAYRAMCIYNQSPEKECDPSRVYHDTATKDMGGIDDADFYFPDFYDDSTG